MKAGFIFIVIGFLNLLQLNAQCNDPSGLGASELGPTSAILSWTSGGAVNWQIQYDTSGFILGTGTLVQTGNNPFTLTNLLPETSYEFYVRDSCGIGDFSNWFGPYLFTTIEIFTHINANLEFSFGDVNWGDYDNDGYLDILSSSSGIYKNYHSDSLININAGLQLSSETDWGDYDNDGDLDVLNSCSDSTYIYRNMGGNSFTKINMVLPSATYGQNSWIDFDNDGDLDIVLSGQIESYNDDAHTIFYVNEGNDIFSEKDLKLKASSDGDIDFGDYNNDGFVDILISGRDVNSNYHVTIYRNMGDGSFIDINANLDYLLYVSSSWCDFDGDNDLDIVMSGANRSWLAETIVYKNSGNDFFEKVSTNLSNIKMGSVSCADIDNDGDNDILLVGATDNSDNLNPLSKIFRNDGNFCFTEIGSNLTGFSGASSSLGDYDNDGDLDILISGSSDGGMTNVLELYKNNLKLNNHKPEIPTGLTSDNGVIVKLYWNKVSDPEAGENNVSYNLLIGTDKNILDIMSPMSDFTTGKRLIPGMGNAFLDTCWVIKDMSPGIYYWKVQAVDNGFLGSEFSEIDSFQIMKVFSPIGIIDENYGYGSIELFDCDKDNDMDILVTGKIASSPDTLESAIYLNEGNNVFEKLPTSLIGVMYGSSSCADYDNDGDIDLLVYGATQDVWGDHQPVSKIYRNDGGGTYTDINANLIGIMGSASWGDYDNDGDLDLVLTGYLNNRVEKTQLYRNDGNDVFTEEPSSLMNMGSSAVKFGDYDNDNDLDILLCGYGSGRKSIIYRNYGGTFYNVKSFDGVSTCSVDWGDYDADGRLDVMIAGTDIQIFNLTKVYHNDGNNKFSDILLDIRQVSKSCSFWADFNNDGYSDILLGGYSGNWISRIYENDKMGSFDDIGAEINFAYESDLHFSDSDSDGDLDVFSFGGGKIILNINHINNPNKKYLAPTSLDSYSLGYGVKFSWEHPSDAQSNGDGLSYNIRLGTTAGGGEVISPMSDPITGYRRVMALGNAQLNTSWRIDSLAEGMYYWSVQAINQNFSGGEWAEEKSFTISVVRADFSADTVCYETETSFIDESLSSGDPIIEWKWDFGDGLTSTLQQPVHTYSTADTFYVQLIAISSQYSDTIYRNAIVKSKPIANFQIDPVCHGEPSVIINQTNDEGLTISSWYWEFGDSQISDQVNPVPHYYAQAGEYNAKLTLTSDNGCFDTISKLAVVAKYPVVIVTADGPVEFCQGEDVLLKVEENSNYIYQWKLDNIPLSDSMNYHCNAIYKGEYSVEVENILAACISSSLPVDVNVIESPVKPVVNISNFNSKDCPKEKLILLSVDQPTIQYDYQWLRNGVEIDGKTKSSIEDFMREGDYSVIAKNDVCGSESDIINIYYDFDLPEKPEILIEGPVVWYLVSSNDSANAYRWHFEGDPIAGADEYIYVAGQQLGKYEVSISNSGGCYTISNPVWIPLGTGIDENPFQNLRIYPNPSPGLFTIEMDNPIMGDLIIDIFGENGSKIINIKFLKEINHFSTQIDLSEQPGGVYLINLLLEKHSASRKLIVE